MRQRNRNELKKVERGKIKLMKIKKKILYRVKGLEM